jgi:alanine dehydrogenase
MVDSGVTGIAYETVEMANGALPLLTPMSEVAGRMSVQVGAYYLERHAGGRGKLMGGIPGVRPASVVIVGGGWLVPMPLRLLWVWELRSLLWILT